MIADWTSHGWHGRTADDDGLDFLRMARPWCGRQERVNLVWWRSIGNGLACDVETRHVAMTSVERLCHPWAVNLNSEWLPKLRRIRFRTLQTCRLLFLFQMFAVMLIGEVGVVIAIVVVEVGVRTVETFGFGVGAWVVSGAGVELDDFF